MPTLNLPTYLLLLLVFQLFQEAIDIFTHSFILGDDYIKATNKSSEDRSVKKSRRHHRYVA